ncbi:Hsp90 cochaperone shq1 [Physocladia obscura]|uniref:Hsp90 cochaperone shq1 n=1 Tax=Physocladia obscura TaxID=109957 RepID=A0AAD5T4E1_9FUNG|nr:Hsp90 cochaperone shq1 [Physocladia obscura]
MLTPHFSTTQTDDAVILTIKTPYVKGSDVEFFVDDCEFKLHIHPYFLRLTFPHAIIENGHETARYDVSRGEITVSLPKKEPGLFFEDLDLLAKLLVTGRGSTATVATAAIASSVNKVSTKTGGLMGRPMIEEIGGNNYMAENDNNEEEEEDEMDEGFDWMLPQELPESDLITGVKYGFNNSYSGFASHVAEIGRDIIDIDNIDKSTPDSRRTERIEKEDAKFDEEYYISDFMNQSEDIERIIKFKPEFWTSLKKIQQHAKLNPTASIMSEIETPIFKSESPVNPEEPISLNMISSSGNITRHIENLKFASDHAIMLESIQDITMNQQTTENPNQLSESTTILSNTPNPPSSLLQKDPRQSNQTNTVTSTSNDINDWLPFTTEEQKEMISLPTRKLLLETEARTVTKSLYLGLVDLCFAYCYDHRTMEGESTVESAWTVAKLSPTLSTFESFGTLHETLVACVRRALAYPLYRNFALCTRVKDDVAILFKLGKRALVKILLGVRRLMRGDDACFVFDRLYLEDYCLWIQSSWCNDKIIRELGSEIHHYELSKSSIGWDLEELELLAVQVE